MLFRFYRTNSDVKNVTKSLTLIKDLQGSVKHDLNGLDCYLNISKADIATVNVSNYVYIPDLERYYFVTEPAEIIGGVIQLKLHVDVLMSLASQFKQDSADIERQENDANLYVPDGLMPAENRMQTVFKEFSLGFSDQAYNYLMIGG